MVKVIIVGAQKSGTTSTQHYLAQYLETSGRELGNLTELGDSNFSLFKDPRIVGSFERRTEVIKELKGTGVIYLFIWRDPSERFLSSFHHSLAYGLIPPMSADTYLAQFQKNHLALYRDQFPRILEPIEFGFYSEGLSALQNTPSSRLIMVDFKKLLSSDAYRVEMMKNLPLEPSQASLSNRVFPDEQRSPRNVLAARIALQSRRQNHDVSPIGAKRLRVSSRREWTANALMVASRVIGHRTRLSESGQKILAETYASDNRAMRALINACARQPVLVGPRLTPDVASSSQ